MRDSAFLVFPSREDTLRTCFEKMNVRVPNSQRSAKFWESSYSSGVLCFCWLEGVLKGAEGVWGNRVLIY